jgi:dTDP-4-amino-4,6-dideoxygalactose transaminase
MKFIDLSYENEKAEKDSNESFSRIMQSGKYLLGECLSTFEQKFAFEQNVNYAIGVKNATDALYMVFKILSAEKRTVIVPQFGAYPTVMAAIQAGTEKIIAAPIDERLTLDLRNVHVPDNSIIVPVHLFGNQAEMKHIEDVASKTNSFIVEDFAQATGIKKSKNSIAAIHSFYPTKPLGCRGDGGAIITDDPNIKDACKKARFYGLNENGEISSWGFNSRLDEWQAAFLCEKIKYYKNLNEIRRNNAAIFKDAIENVGFKYVENCVYHQFVVLWKNRDLIKDFLEKSKIPTLIHYPKMLSDMPYLKNKVEFLPCRKVSEHVLSIPVGPHLTDKEIDKISCNLRENKKHVIQFEEICKIS